jgi:hypothetical protein
MRLILADHDAAIRIIGRSSTAVAMVSSLRVGLLITNLIRVKNLNGPSHVSFGCCFGIQG